MQTQVHLPPRPLSFHCTPPRLWKEDEHVPCDSVGKTSSLLFKNSEIVLLGQPQAKTLQEAFPHEGTKPRGSSQVCLAHQNPPDLLAAAGHPH